MFLINWDAKEILRTFIINVKSKLLIHILVQGFIVKTVFNLIPTHLTHTHHLIQKPTACLIQNMKKLFYLIYQPLDTKCLSYSKPFTRAQQSQNQPT